MVSLHRGRFVVVHLYPTFYVAPAPEFFLRGKFIPTITSFRDFGAVNPHFKATTMKFGVRVRILDSLFQAKFCIKNSIKGYTFFGKFIPKIPILAILGHVVPYF